MPTYRLQIVDEEDQIVMSGPPGAKGPFEVDLIARCTEAIAARGVGLLKTEAQVRAAIREGMEQVFRAYKTEARPLVQPR